MTAAPASPQALAEAEAAAEERAQSAQEALRRTREEARERAARFGAITTETHIEAAQIRALADQVRLEDPAAIEAAQVAAAEARLAAVAARYAVLESTQPDLQAELDRRQADVDRATEARNAARIALSHTQPMFNGKDGEMSEARRQLTTAQEAARKGAEDRLAALTGILPPEPVHRTNLLGRHINLASY